MDANGARAQVGHVSSTPTHSPKSPKLECATKDYSLSRPEVKHALCRLLLNVVEDSRVVVHGGTLAARVKDAFVFATAKPGLLREMVLNNFKTPAQVLFACVEGSGKAHCGHPTACAAGLCPGRTDGRKAHEEEKHGKRNACRQSHVRRSPVMRK